MMIAEKLIRNCGDLFRQGVAVLAVVLLAAWPGALHGADSCVVEGKVVDGVTGKPLPDVKFLLFVRNASTGRNKTEVVAADQGGAFRVTVEPNSDVIVVWQNQVNSDYLFDADWLQRTGNAVVRLGVIKEDRTGLVLKTKVRSVSKLTGKVVEPNGRPALGASVYSSAEMQPVVTTPSGEFVLKAAPGDGDYELFVISADKKGCTVAHVKAGTRETEIVLSPSCDVEGQVIAEDGKPAAGLNFWMVPMINGEPMGMLMGQYACTADRSGAFVARNLCPNVTYVASWYASGGENANYCEGNVKVTVKPDETITLRVKRFSDDWQASGNIGVSKETQCSRLTNYCLDKDDNILACDGGQSVVRVISPEDKLLATWRLSLTPQAITCRNDGTAVVAGGGRIALLNKSGKAIREGKLPDAEASGVGWSGNDVFVAVREGIGYSIYRYDGALTRPVQIVKGLRGCCGQMDFTAKDGVVYVAANCLFKVMKYDRNGKEVGSFGKRGQGGDEGFNGCCEPKNVCFDSKGNLYTAESGQCCVKKFTPDGKYLGLMGAVNGIRGCVRVTIALPKDCSKIYMLDTGRNIIRALPLPDKEKGGRT